MQNSTSGFVATPSVSTNAASDPNPSAVDSLLHGTWWPNPRLSFSFPDTVADTPYNWRGEQGGFRPFTDIQADAARKALAELAAVSGLSFYEKTGGADRDATLKFANNAATGTAYSYFPDSSSAGGDTFYNPGLFAAPTQGGYAWSNLIHEIGHAVGLKHGHEGYNLGATPREMDSHEFSLMTYRSYINGPTAWTNGQWGAPQSLMMLDIAALQQLYGANFAHNAGATVYRVDPNSGAFSINGEVVATPGANVAFRTVWDGGGRDRYDFSAYRTDLEIDLSPGGHVDLDVGGLSQRAELGPGQFARGHIFNAMLHEGDLRSLIEHANGGRGDDLLIGNAAGNKLKGGSGADTLAGGLGEDTLIGGAGQDMAVFEGLSSEAGIRRKGAHLLIDGDLVKGSVEQVAFDDGVFAFRDLAEQAGAVGATRSPSASAASGPDDLMTGGAGADVFKGRRGDDTLSGGGGDDRLMGGGGADRLAGDADDDFLKGGGGGDRLTGGAGDDTLIGGGGADVLVFTRGDGDDVVRGLSRKDVLDLSAFGLASLDDVAFEATDGGGRLTLSPDQTITVERAPWLEAGLEDALLL